MDLSRIPPSEKEAITKSALGLVGCTEWKKRQNWLLRLKLTQMILGLCNLPEVKSELRSPSETWVPFKFGHKLVLLHSYAVHAEEKRFQRCF